MRRLLQFIIYRTTLRGKAQGGVSRFAEAQAYRALRIHSVRVLKDIFLIAAGVACAAFGLEGFLMTNRFIDGGVTGISLLVSETTGWELWPLLVLFNVPFLLLAIRVVGKGFAIRAAAGIAGLAMALAVFSFPNVTDDKLLVAVFGGFFIGAGVGLSIRGGGVIDGTEILAIALSKRFGATIGDIIILINVLVFSAAAYFLSVEAALYSMITYLAASKTLDFVLEGVEEYTAINILSPKSEEVRSFIVNEMGRGVTIYHGRRGMQAENREEVDIVFTVLTRFELNRLTTGLKKIDPNAFVVMHSVKDIHGGVVKKRPHKH
ncbi:MAG: YitT family protein [Flavobacteriales bacterium]